MAITVEFNVLEKEAKLEEIRKDKVGQEKLISSEVKLEMLTDTISKTMHILGRKDEKYKVEVGADYSKHLVPFSWEEPNQSFQCKDSYQNILAEQGCKEEDAESCQVSTICLPTSCASLLTEHYKQIANRNKVECPKESIRDNIDNANHFAYPEVFPLIHLEITKSKVEKEPNLLGSLPLCFNSFQILKGNLHPKDLLATIHESHAQVNSHKNQEKLVEDETNQEIKENP